MAEYAIGRAVSVRSVLLPPPAILFRKYKSVKSGEEVAGGGRFFSMVKYTQERAMQRTTE